MIGRTLGDFIVRERIGEGGFGVVYRAEQPLLGREAVVKISTAAGTSEYIDRFLREARLASRIDHPYAAHIYAFGSEPDGTLWTAMELVRGMGLDRMLQQGPIRLERFAGLFDKLCEVVHTAHEQGIIHRDLKPANVMVLSRAGRLLPKLLDLGIAKSDEPEPVKGLALGSGNHTQAGRWLGSPAYMAPEQWVDPRKADARTDVYALGVLAYETLTAKRPFEGTSVLAIARHHAKSSVPPLGPNFPPALDAVIAKAMAKRQRDRYASALELASAMRDALDLGGDDINLPELDPFLRERIVNTAPQPIAEAVAALEAARNVHQAQAAVIGIVRVLARVVGAIAVACWCRASREVRGEPSAELTDLLRTLRRHGLTDPEWIGLARAVALVFSERREVCAVPELVDLTAAGTGDAVHPAADDLAQLTALKSWSDDHPAAAERAIREQLELAMPKLAAALERLAWLQSYALVVPAAAHAELWMGIRRPYRHVTTLRTPGATGVLLCDPTGTLVLELSPLFRVAAPAPGQPSEMFVLDGANRDGARMISFPTGFEITDRDAWAWLGEHADLGDESRGDLGDERPPYRGLATFTRDDVDQFVGRERETEAFVNRLRITPLLVVVGASGAGKSSFVQAGVVPALGDGWTTIIARPGASPVATLAATVSRALGRDVAVDKDGLATALRAWVDASPTEPRRILLYIDQFEELFTLCHDSAERERYVGALVRAAKSADDPIRVVLTVRDDFLLRCQQVEALRDRLGQGLQLLATPTPADLERILVEPARRAGYEFEDPELPVEMVGAVAEMPAALPLLSFTAAQMWDLRDRHNRRLSRKAYETLGGVGGALAQHAERVFAQMSGHEQRIVRVAFRNLVTADGTRAVMTRAGLLEVTGDPTVGELVLERLIHARLLTASEAVGGDRVEVVHEALLGAWPRLIDWRREDAEGARLRDQLRAAARQWDERGRPRGLLWRGEALTEYQLWRARHQDPLLAVEQAFADGSLRDAARWRRLRNTAVLTFVGVLLVGMVVALVLYRDAESQRARAATNEQRAVAGEARANELVVSGYLDQGQRAALVGDAGKALVYLTAAKHGGASGLTVDLPLAEARSGTIAEKAVYRGHDGKVLAVIALPDGKRFATSGADHVVAIWNIDDGASPIRRLLDSPASVTRIAASSDGRWLATAALDGHVRLYDANTWQLVHDWELERGKMLFTLQFTPDGRRIVACSEEQQVGVWDAATGAVVQRFKADGETVGYGQLTPDGRYLAIPSYDRQTRLWDIATAKLVRTFGPHTDTVWGIAFSPDGSTLATASWDKNAKLWDVATGKLRATLVGHSAPLVLAQWATDGTLLATGGRDGVVRVWDRNGQLKASLACPGLAHALKWLGSSRVIAACGDATMVFDVAAGLPVFRKPSTSPEVEALAVLPSGDVLSAEADGTVRRWAPTMPVTYVTDGHAASVMHLDRCTDDVVLTVSEDHSAKQWRTGALEWRTPPTLRVSDASCAPGSAEVVVATLDGALWRRAGGELVKVPLDEPLPNEAIIGLSPDRTRVAVVDADNRASLIELGARTIRHSQAARFKRSWEPKLYWANDGSVFALMSDSGAIVWDGKTGQRRFEVPPPGGLVRRILIDVPSGSLFVSSMAPGVRRYALRDGKELPAYASAGFAWGVSVVGDRLYVGYDDSTVVEYDIATARRVRVLGTFTGDVFSVTDAGSGLFWIGSADRRLSLIDSKTRAVLYRIDVAADPMFVGTSSGFRAAVAGLSGSLTFVDGIAAPSVALDRLDLEVRCRTTQRLANGTLEPHEVELDACRALAERKR